MFWNSEANAVEVVTSNRDFIRKLYLKGFLKAGRGIAFFYKCTEKNRLNIEAERIENWHFTNFASDGYSFP